MEVDEEVKQDQDATREQFEVELEFVLCLANPAYLNFLAQSEYLDKPDFLEYIDYLQYWTKPEYVRFILFPHALYFLRLLKEAPFREAIKRGDYLLMVQQQQDWMWQFGRTLKPMKPISETPNANPIPVQNSAPNE